MRERGVRSVLPGRADAAALRVQRYDTKQTNKQSIKGPLTLMFPVCSSETNSSCKVCCRGGDGVCAPYRDDTGSFLFLRKGKPCTVGFCDGAVRTVLLQNPAGGGGGGR